MKVVNQVKGINGGNLVEIKTFHKAQLGWTQLGSEQVQLARPKPLGQLLTCE